jgi:hypothetical protein
MKQTELGAAIESAKGEATEVKTVKVDIFDIPETKGGFIQLPREKVCVESCVHLQVQIENLVAFRNLSRVFKKRYRRRIPLRDRRICLSVRR